MLLELAVAASLTVAPRNQPDCEHPDGTVVLRFEVRRDGTVADVSVKSSTNHALDPMAIAAGRKWRFKSSGQPTVADQPMVFCRDSSD